jgi:hypothetical protein
LYILDFQAAAEASLSIAQEEEQARLAQAVELDIKYTSVQKTCQSLFEVLSFYICVTFHHLEAWRRRKPHRED